MEENLLQYIVHDNLSPIELLIQNNDNVTKTQIILEVLLFFFNEYFTITTKFMVNLAF